MNEDLNAWLLGMSNSDFDALMCKKFSKLFVDRNKDMRETCMCWGFEIPAGWHVIVHNLCEQLQYLADLTKYQPVADQVKSKFGALRFYWHGVAEKEGDYRLVDDIMEALVGAAEHQTGHTCEVCGAFGESNALGWVTTLCMEHRKLEGKRA